MKKLLDYTLREVMDLCVPESCTGCRFNNERGAYCAVINGAIRSPLDWRYVPEHSERDIKDAESIKRVLPWVEAIIRTPHGLYARGAPGSGAAPYALPGDMFPDLEINTERLLLKDIIEV